MTRITSILRGAAMSLAVATLTPALAQPADEVILVEGSYGRVPDSVRSLSQRVSYADLDLSTAAGKSELGAVTVAFR